MQQNKNYGGKKRLEYYCFCHPERSEGSQFINRKGFFAMLRMTKKQQGFTLIEMVLTIGIIALLAAFSIPVYGNLFTRNDLDDAKMIVVQALRRAELSAQAEDGANINSTTANPLWGVDIQNGNVTVFRGQTYAGRVQSDDEVYPIGNTVTVTSSPVDIFFSPETGFSTSASTVSATLTVSSGESRTISVSPNGGKVEY